MRQKSFISQLKTIQNNFLKYAKENSTEINMSSFEINIANRYLTLRVECEDKYGDCIVFYQEVEMDSGKIYQNDLIPLSINAVF